MEAKNMFLESASGAEKHLDEELEYLPGDEKLAEKLGDICTLNSQMEEAVTFYLRALEVGSETSSISFHAVSSNYTFHTESK